MENGLAIQSLTLARDGHEILRECSWTVRPGELLVISGSNGIGKSTLLLSVMGQPGCDIKSGDIMLDGASIVQLPAYERARRGLFLIHQEPPAIPGITIAGAIRAEVEALRGGLSIPAVQAEIREACQRLKIDEAFSRRPLNDGLSGGEKKRAELLQMLLAKPRFVLIDELDSGLDADMLKTSIKLIADLRAEGVGFVVVSHNQSFTEALCASNTLGL